MNPIDYISLVACCALFGAAAALTIWQFANRPREKQVAQVCEWLLGAVTWAEAQYGSGTGRIKLSEVYARFCTEMPWVAKIMTFETFSKLVDDALLEMRALLESNARVKELVDNGG